MKPNAVRKTAVIVIDSGFNRAALSRCRNIVALFDVDSGRSVVGEPFIDGQDAALEEFAIDDLNHGSIVVERLLAACPDVPVILIRAYGRERRLIRTQWDNGSVVRDGWVEAYLRAVELCKDRGYSSVANCSFGGFTHAMDGTGWEAFNIGKVTGSGKPGHVMIAGAGPGDGRSVHASWVAAGGDNVIVKANQERSAMYSLWASVGASSEWTLEVYLNGEQKQVHHGRFIPANFWNGRQQLTFHVEGDGELTFVMRMAAGEASRFDLWVVDGGSATFSNLVDVTLVAEPAVFPFVIAAGLRAGKYANDQETIGAKPDVLMEGFGAISFRLPELVAFAACALEENPALDVDGVRALIGKFPTAAHLSTLPSPSTEPK